MEDTPNNTRNSRMARMPTLVANNLHLIVFVDQIWMEQLSKWGSFATTYGYHGAPDPAATGTARYNSGLRSCSAIVPQSPTQPARNRSSINRCGRRRQAKCSGRRFGVRGLLQLRWVSLSHPRLRILASTPWTCRRILGDFNRFVRHAPHPGFVPSLFSSVGQLRCSRSFLATRCFLERVFHHTGSLTFDRVVFNPRTHVRPELGEFPVVHGGLDSVLGIPQ